jgi:hypothetical protein
MNSISAFQEVSLSGKGRANGNAAVRGPKSSATRGFPLSREGRVRGLGVRTQPEGATAHTDSISVSVVRLRPIALT